MGKATGSFKSVSKRLPGAFSNASSASFAISGSSVNGLNGLRELFTLQLIPALNNFTRAAKNSFQMLRAEVGHLSVNMRSFLTNTNQQMGNYSTNLSSSTTLIKRKKEETGKLEKYMNKFNLAMDTYNNISDLANKLTNKGKKGLGLLGGAMTKARGATGALSGAFRIFGTSLKAGPIGLLVGTIGLLAASAIAGRNSMRGIGMVGSHRELINNDENFNQAANKMDRYGNNLNVLDLNQLKGFRSELDTFIKSLKNEGLGVAFDLNSQLKALGIKESDLPTDLEILNSQKMKMHAFDRPTPVVFQGEMPKTSTVKIDDAQASLLLAGGSSNLPERTTKDWLLSGSNRHLMDRIWGLRYTRDTNRYIEMRYAEKQKQIDALIEGKTHNQNPDGQLGLANGANTIAAGGRKMTHITINLDKMVENIAVSAERLEDGLEEVETMVKEVFLRVLNSGNYAAQ